MLFPIYLLASGGGYGFITEQLGAADPDLLRFIPALDPRGGAATLFGFLLGSGALGINFGYPGQPHVLVRFMALKDATQTRAGAVISAVWATMVYWGAVTVGLMVRAMTEAQATQDIGAAWTAGLDGETGLVLAAVNMIPGALSGVVLAAVLAAICSTADSQLVVAASSAANDIYSRLIDRTRKRGHLLINRLVVLGLGLIAVGLVIDKDIQVYRYVLTYGWAILGASFGPQIVLLLLWKRASYAGCVAGMATGLALALWWPHVYDPAEHREIEIYNLPFAFVTALAVNVVMSLLLPSKQAP